MRVSATRSPRARCAARAEVLLLAARSQATPELGQRRCELGGAIDARAEDRTPLQLHALDSTQCYEANTRSRGQNNLGTLQSQGLHVGIHTAVDCAV